MDTKDIFNIQDDNSDHSDAEYDSEQEREQRQKKNVSASKKSQTKKTKGNHATAVFGLDKDEDGSSSGSDSEQEEDSRFQLQDGEDDEEDDEEEENPFGDDMEDEADNVDEDQEDATQGRARGLKKKKKTVKPLTPEELEKFQKAQEKTGIIYLSRVPPFMQVKSLRRLLAAYGKIGRIYLAPEDAKVAARRKKYGGNRRQNFTEGWVEFMDKSIAKQVAQSLNTTTIGGKKRGCFHDDIWNIKYLPKFKWNHLTERVAYENASRAQRLQAEISQAKRENKFILETIEKSKMIKSIEEKKSVKRKSEGEGTSSKATAKATTGEGANDVRRSFKQRRLTETSSVKPAVGSGADKSKSKIKSVLGSVLGR
ncbi:RNA-binding ATPase activator esf2 [Lunasporangiospora selenospora]|uniref:18S rRNA factor 2 n=1 Tax=Lunasporangiospora selenospora TaxID=979761 RepID=A0A9P6KC12_9FUNG|nr:RNA-binding ATPase activator esf2 [Lunasporangiospora selenospora]